jgi:hypothetical protein
MRHTLPSQSDLESSFASRGVSCKEIKIIDNPQELYRFVQKNLLEMDAAALSTALDHYAELASGRSLALNMEMVSWQGFAEI